MKESGKEQDDEHSVEYEPLGSLAIAAGDIEEAVPEELPFGCQAILEPVATVLHSHLMDVELPGLVVVALVGVGVLESPVGRFGPKQGPYPVLDVGSGDPVGLLLLADDEARVGHRQCVQQFLREGPVRRHRPPGVGEVSVLHPGPGESDMVQGHLAK